MFKGFNPLTISLALGLSCLPVHATVIGLADQTALRLTVYNHDFALVQDHRNLPKLTAGERLFIDQLSPNILAETLRIQGAGDILEQGISHNALNYQSLLEAHRGQSLQLARLNNATGNETVAEVTLLSVEGQHALIRREQQIESIPLSSPEWRFIFPAELPLPLQGNHGIHFVSAGTAKPSNAQFSYLTSGLGWKMDYVMTLDASGKAMAVEGLASVYNHTGGRFNSAELQLMAGDIHAPSSQPPMMMRAMAMNDMLGHAPEHAVEAVQDFYLYRLPHPVSFDANETKQLPLVQIEALEAQLQYRYQFNVWPVIDQQKHQAQANIALTFEAPKLADQQTPLPAGQVRVFRPDRQGDLHFMGAAQLSNLASGEKAELGLGRAFDLTVQRRQTLFSDGFDSVSLQYEVTVNNAGSDGRVVDLQVGFQDQWQLKEATHPMQEDSAGQLSAKMHLAAGGSETLRFTVELKKRERR